MTPITSMWQWQPTGLARALHNRLWLWNKWFSPILQITRGKTSKWFHVVHNRYITIFMVHNLTEIIRFQIGNVAYVATVFFNTYLALFSCAWFLSMPSLFKRARLVYTCATLFQMMLSLFLKSRDWLCCTLLSHNTLRQQHTCCGICKLICLSSNRNSTTHAVSCLPFAERQKQS
jgi:hypothetical protein